MRVKNMSRKQQKAVFASMNKNTPVNHVSNSDSKEKREKLLKGSWNERRKESVKQSQAAYLEYKKGFLKNKKVKVEVFNTGLPHIPLYTKYYVLPLKEREKLKKHLRKKYPLVRENILSNSFPEIIKK